MRPYKSFVATIILTSAIMSIVGCAGIKQEQFVVSRFDGTTVTVDYIHGKIDADGQTGVFRDVYLDGQPVLSHFGGGQSLLGQILQHSGAAAIFTGGVLGHAALLRPDREVTATNVEVEKAELQSLAEPAPVISEPTSSPITVINNNSSRSVSRSRSQSNARSNSLSKGGNANIKMGNISGGSGGGVPGCQKAKFGC